MSYENLQNIRKNKAESVALLTDIDGERFEITIVYAFFMDNVNTHSPIVEFIYSPNICQEILISTWPSARFMHSCLPKRRSGKEQ